MKNFIKKNFLFLYFFIVALVLYANATHSLMLDITFKPLIVISLIIYLFVEDGQKEKAVTFAITGLLLSLSGDIFLVFQGENALFFIGGLVSFLAAHVFYIFYYFRSSDTVATKKLKNKPLFIFVMICYGILFCLLLYNNLGELKVPVFVYTTVLVGMNIFALNRYGKVNDTSFKLIMTGALCFAISDSLLAVNKFLLPIPLSGIWILGTYAAAQYFITKGVISKK